MKKLDRIKITNYKSIRDLDLELSDFECLYWCEWLR